MNHRPALRSAGRWRSAIFLFPVATALGLATAFPSFAQQVKVMQYNVNGHLGNTGSNSSAAAKAIARIINYNQPDIVTFNELQDNGTITTAAAMIDWVTNNLTYFGSKTGVTFWVDIATVGDGSIRNGSISRYPISGAFTYSDAGGGYGNLRGMESFKVQLSGTNALEIFHVHLKCCSDGTSCPKKQEEAGVDATNMMYWASTNSFPYVFTGDCNEDENPANSECATNSTYHPITTLRQVGGLVEYLPTTLSGGALGTLTWSTTSRSIRFDYVLAATNRLSPVSGYVFSTTDWASHGLFTNAGSGNLTTDSSTASDHYCVQANYFFPTSVTNFNVTPTNAFTSSGNPGGPFSPSNQVYTLTNTDTIPLFWSVTKNAGWLTVSPVATNLDLGIGQSTNITASINSAANSLSAGTYTDTINFSNTATGVSISRGVTLTVLTQFQSWQLQYFACTNCPQADPSADPDGDGFANLQEFLAGTIPTNSASGLRILSATLQGNDVLIAWQTAGGRTNALQASDGAPDLSYSTNFTDISPSIVIPGSGDATTNFLEVGAATNAPARYYRVRLVP
ncbi:MAG: endonuclease/exonuclease/phosphatase family protein [Verrucomicrobiia bacterium]